MLNFEVFEKEINTFASADAVKRPGFYEKLGAWVDMVPWLETTGRERYSNAIDSFVQHSHRDEDGKCPSCFCVCCGKDRYARNDLNSKVWRFVKEMFSLSVILTMIAGVIAISLSLLYLRLIAQDGT